MRKYWLLTGAASLLLAACSLRQPPATVSLPAAYRGPVSEIPGVEPRYEPINPVTNQDYTMNGKTYHIVAHPGNFSQTGLAGWHQDDTGNTAIGEQYDPEALTAAHPALPLPGYVRVTNLANGRQIVVRINDRGPFKPGRIIDLSRAAAQRLNISGNSKVRVDYILVAADGSLSGPGTVGTRVAKQSYTLPSRPDISILPSSQTDASTAAGNMHASSARLNPAAEVNRQNTAAAGTAVQSYGWPGTHNAPSVARQAKSPLVPAATGAGYLVQVGSLRDSTRAHQWLSTLSERFAVPGKVIRSSENYRVQLGPFTDRQQAAALQQRLSTEAQQHAFIIVDAGGESQ